MRTKLTFIPYKRVKAKAKAKAKAYMVSGSCMTDLRKWFFFLFH